jgi:hypothetical protein
VVVDEALETKSDTDFLDLEKTQELESCLQRGRPYATSTSLDPGVQGMVQKLGAEDSLDYYDLDVELELQDLDPPIEVVRVELAFPHAQLFEDARLNFLIETDKSET